MRSRLALGAILLAWMTGCSEPATPISSAELHNKPSTMHHPIESMKIDPEDLRWEARPLVLFADQPDNPLLARQLTALAECDEQMSKRSMVVIRVVGQSVRVGLGHDVPIAGTPELATRWRRVVKPEPEAPFHAALMGLDGGVKMTAHEPVSFERLRRLIDSMPMRQAEIRRQAD